MDFKEIVKHAEKLDQELVNLLTSDNTKYENNKLIVKFKTLSPKLIILLSKLEQETGIEVYIDINELGG